MRIQAIGPGLPVMLFAMAKPVKSRLIYQGGATGAMAGGPLPTVEVYAEGHKLTTLSLAGQSILVETAHLEVSAIGGTAIIALDTFEDTPATPAPLPTPGPAPSPAPASGSTTTPKCSASATIINQGTEVHATGGRRITISGIVTIAPKDFLPGQASLTVRVSKDGVATNLGGEVTTPVKGVSETLEVVTGLVRPGHVIDVVLAVVASDGTTIVVKHSMKSVA